MIYCSGQVTNIFPHINFDPKWFILGGPADGDEAQVFNQKYPGAKILGLEPGEKMFAYQMEVGFPGTLLFKALSNDIAVKQFKETANQGGFLVVDETLGIRGLTFDTGISALGLTHDVQTTTLDQLDLEYGPFVNAVLWMDIEGSEMDALKGGEGLLSRSDGVLLLSMEIIEPLDRDSEVELDRFKGFLSKFNYTVVHTWNCGYLGSRRERYRKDVVFRKV